MRDKTFLLNSYCLTIVGMEDDVTVVQGIKGDLGTLFSVDPSAAGKVLTDRPSTNLGDVRPIQGIV